jgi:hypothetical protein
MKCKRLLFLFFFGLSQYFSVAQEPCSVLNTYVRFINESIHGLRIVHGLLENFNQDLNKFVDLESTQINAYKNKHLPANIFEDPEAWFFINTPSPETLFSQLKEESYVLGEEKRKVLMDLAFELRKTYLELNSLRFEIENYMVENSLEEISHQKAVFTLMERGVELYENFYTTQKILYASLKASFGEYCSGAMSTMDKNYQIMHEAHSLCFSFLEALRYKDDIALSDLLKRINTYQSAGKLNTLNVPVRSKIITKWDQFAEQANVFITQASVPSDHKLYGKFYYYHNKVLIPFTNWQGLGFVRFMNEALRAAGNDRLHFMEIPVFLQLVYPKKLDPIEHLAASDPKIELLPEKLKDREVVIRNHTMYVDSFLLEIKVYDHKLEDGDIISLNFNGDWILEEFTLSAKPKVFKLKINEEGKNYLLLHALNLGKRPPNTMALSYTYRGEKQTIVLSSNLNESEMIEIIYKGPND